MLAHVFSSCDVTLTKTSFVIELADKWVQVRDIEIVPDAEGPRPGLLALRFSIHVSGQHAANATL